MLSSIDPPPPIAPMERQGVIEIDTFCTGCHYNLHGQVVRIDERLGFPICRCPECGKFHPAGTGVTAAGVWVRRFASILLFSWICVVIAGQIAIAGAMAGFDAASIGIYSYGYEATLDGKPVSYAPTANSGSVAYVVAGKKISPAQVKYFQGLHPWYGDVPKDEPGLSGMVMLSLGSLLLGFIAATLCVTLLWHWPGPRYAWGIIIALVPAILVSIPFATADEYQFIRVQCFEHILSQTGFQCLGLLLGVMLGRPLARQIIRMIIPPKPRQALAFLWIVDGKKPPDTVPG